ncbi:MAG: hypothetical protein RBS77_05405 [Candidatus Moranbacteria bacterium]|jgi:hypothetical protein|nr:hypothetical protein [Candidatus Moranbacteria bacterium]
MATKFLELNKNFQDRMCTVPQAVFVTLDPDDETFEQIVERQDKFIKLPEAVKDKLLSHETAEKIKSIGKHYDLELLQMAPIARVIRSYYFGEVKLEDFADVIMKESKINLEDAQNIARYITEKIIKKEAPVVAAVPTVKMTIAQAVEKFPEVEEQILTSASIEVDGKMARPTIKSWKKDYFNVVGADNRDIMKRSSYLYHSKNVKNLNATDRQKLSNLLKSLDEGFLLRVDAGKKEIVFDSAPVINKNMTGSSVDMSKKVEQPVLQKPTVVMNEVTPKSDKPVFEKKEEDKVTNDRPLISHVQGNKWDLKSAHFIKREEFDNKAVVNNNQENIKFFSPQQLPVEKENDLSKPIFKEETATKSRSLKNFFGRIEPVE